MEKARSLLIHQGLHSKTAATLNPPVKTAGMRKEQSFSRTLQNLRQARVQLRRSSDRLKVNGNHSLDAHNSLTVTNSDVYKLDPTSMLNKQGQARPSLSMQTQPANQFSRLSASKIRRRKLKRGLSAVVVGTRLTRPSAELKPKAPEQTMKVPQPRKQPLVRRVYAAKQACSAELRDLVFLDFLHKLRLSNGVQLGDHGVHYYKFFIGPGNNPGLVKRVLKKRWWWVPSDSMEDAHFIWTSVLSSRVLRCLHSSQTDSFVTTEATESLLPRQYAKKLVLEQQNQGYFRILRSPHFHTFACTSAEVNNLQSKVYNRLEGNKQLCSKKRLFKNLSEYCEGLSRDVFDIVPLTFHVTERAQDPQYKHFERVFKARAQAGENNLWIVKPGESSNRGHGIKVCGSFQAIQEIVCSPSYHTFIIQKYIERPLLVHNRKFDIRCYGLLTCINGYLQGYYYREGYIRTSSVEYSLDSCSKYIHLTNDAVQKYSCNYGKFEAGNKLSYADLQAYFDERKVGVSFSDWIQPQMQGIVQDTFRAYFQTLGQKRRSHSYELFGYDFMIDADYKVWLIEVNTNPCLEESCSFLSKLLTQVLDNTFRIAVDPLFPPPPSRSKNLLSWVNQSGIENSFDLVFAESEENQNTELVESHAIKYIQD